MLGHRTLNGEDYLSILKRRGWIILIPLLILPFLSIAFSYTIPPQYLSQTLVLVDSQKVPDSLVKPVISSDLDSRLASMKEQILSRSSLQPIIERYNLYQDNKKLSLDDRIDLTRKGVEIRTITSEVSHSGLPGFFIAFKYSDARTAQLVCSDITTLFTGENLKSREAAAEGTTDFIKSQLDDAKRSLDEQDARLAAFQRQYIGRLPSENSPNIDMLNSTNTQLEATTQALARMEQDKVFAESILNQALSAAPSLSTTSGSNISPAAAQSLQLELQALQAQRAALLTHYTADYPDVVAINRHIGEVRQQIEHIPSPSARAETANPLPPSHYDSPAIQQLRAQIHSADIGIQAKRKEQATLQSNLRLYQERVQSSPLVEQKYKEVTRDYQTAQAFYDNLLSKMNDANMARDLEKRQQGEQFRVLDAANLPEAPFSPKRSVFLMGGLAGGLALGCLIVALLEYRDTTLRSERDIWAFTQLPTLAIVAYSNELGQDEPKRHWFRKNSNKSTRAEIKI